MIEKLSDKARIEKLRRANRELSHAIDDIIAVCDQTSQHYRKNGWKENYAVRKISDLAKRARTRLGNREAEEREIREGAPRNQMKIGYHGAEDDHID